MGVCDDAADAASRIAELLILDNDPETAEVFRNISAERAVFKQRLALLPTEQEGQDAIDPEGRFPGRLFRWRLRIAKHLPVGYSGTDDRRFLLHLARRGSDLVTRAYTGAEARPLGPVARQEVHRQADAVRLADRRVRRLEANA